MAVVVNQFQLFFALVFSFCFVLPLIQATDVKYCEKTDYGVKVSGVEISPYPVSRGKNTTFSIAASTGEAISGGKLVIDVSYFGWQIHSETHDLCTETSCPVSIGDFVISHSQVLPGFTPPGSYTLKLTMVDGDKHRLTCFKFDFYIGFFEQSGSVAYA
ncbi:hypothetical protein LguiA_021760 [Lonicera macranthoides]